MLVHGPAARMYQDMTFHRARDPPPRPNERSRGICGTPLSIATLAARYATCVQLVALKGVMAVEGMLYAAPTGSGKTLSLMEWAFALQHAGKASRGIAKRVRRNIGDLDRLRGDLERNGIQVDVITTPPAAVPPADMNWQPVGQIGMFIAPGYHGVSHLSAEPKPAASGPVLPEAQTPFTSGFTGKPVIFPPPALVAARAVSFLWPIVGVAVCSA